MDSSTPSDRSMNGLVVFLTLFVFLAVLTSGLLVCLVKIWCGKKKTCNRTLAEVCHSYISTTIIELRCSRSSSVTSLVRFPLISVFLHIMIYLRIYLFF
ncbi:unnamed protein product [Heligmosomoides polygyrus]|uniref:Col_cuticle_N domain-containing protein n=1 Tax=Heligmosomoides polygyrus TaxID=6339 RepID=A0A183FS21_HELPZ|nr:unnamed protein product [Heligmosomoides polygyrus]